MNDTRLDTRCSRCGKKLAFDLPTLKNAYTFTPCDQEGCRSVKVESIDGTMLMLTQDGARRILPARGRNVKPL
jgi:hypothetical protein